MSSVEVGTVALLGDDRSSTPLEFLSTTAWFGASWVHARPEHPLAASPIVTGLVAVAVRLFSQLTGPVKFTVVHGLVGQSAIALLMAHPAAAGAAMLSGT